MKTIDDHIQKDQEEFLKALADHNDGKVRHLTAVSYTHLRAHET